MKKVLGVLIVIFLVHSCGSVDIKMDKAIQGVNTGMSVADFKNIVTKSTLVQKEVNYACYKLTKTSEKFGEPGGRVYQTRFFYFKDDKLYRIDEGVRATDLKIEIAQDVTTHTDSKNISDKPQYVDVVYLKNESVIKGMIIEQIPNVSLKIQTRDGSVFVYKMDEVLKITKELSQVN